MAVEVNGNKIEIKIELEKPVKKEPTPEELKAKEVAKHKKELRQQENLVNDVVAQASSIGGSLPVVGKYISSFTSIGNSAKNVASVIAEAGTAGTSGTGGGGGGGAVSGTAKRVGVTGAATIARLNLLGLIVSALGAAHDFTSSYLQNKRQAEIISRRAGFSRRQT